MQNGKTKCVALVCDMRGCPNRCLHCWLGDLPNQSMKAGDDEWIVSLFKPYFQDVTFYSWLREPDFCSDYRKQWVRDCALSTKKPERFELASFYRIVRDPDYVDFLKEVGVKKVQLTFFGKEDTTDRYVGRKGAYQELLKATKILQDHDIAPRYQLFINMENKDEIYPQIVMAKSLGIEEIFVHEGSCDGNNRKLYGIRIEKNAIPKEVIPYYLNYGDLLTEEECCRALAHSQDHYAPHNEGDIVLNITSDYNVYFNFTDPKPAWCLGNLKENPIEDIVKNAVEESVPALKIARAITIGELVERYGDKTSKKGFELEDYKEYLLNRHLDEVYNLPKALIGLSKKLAKGRP